jgi:hypothetical protein
MTETSSRRSFIKMAAIGAAAVGVGAGGKDPVPELEEIVRLHAKATAGIHILPGQWRPHYPYEQIAWIRPSWGGDQYVWLDFPEAIFTEIGLIFLSHINPQIRSMYPELPKVEWQVGADGISYERTLPNGVRFGGRVSKETDTKVALRLFLQNGMDTPLRKITLQTCAFLHGIKEFADETRDNKFVFVREAGWVPFEKARDEFQPGGRYMLGWRGGPAVADWPVMAVRSNAAERHLAMTWYESTLSLVSNKWHPCLHADPFFPDLEPGTRADIHGSLFFVEGSLEDVARFLKKDNPSVFS